MISLRFIHFAAEIATSHRSFTHASRVYVNHAMQGIDFFDFTSPAIGLFAKLTAQYRCVIGTGPGNKQGSPSQSRIRTIVSDSSS